MKHTTLKTFLVFIFILILAVFFIFSPNNYSIEKFSNIQDDLIINEDDYIYTANTKEIFINQTFKDTKLFSNATIESITKDYITDDVIVIDNFNNTYFDNKILIGNKSIDIYLDKTRPKQFDFFYYYIGNKPGVVRFFNSDGSMEDKNTKHKAINSFVLTNNTDNKIGTDLNYIFAYDLIENRPNVNYKTITFMNTKNGANPPTTSTNEENEPYKSVKSNDVLSNINEIDCNLSLIGNSDMSSIINGNTACTVKNTNKKSNIPITFSTNKVSLSVPSPSVPSPSVPSPSVPSPSVPSPSVPSPSVPSPSVPNPAIMNALASAPSPKTSPNPTIVRGSTPNTYSPLVTSSPNTYAYSPSPSVPKPSPSVPNPSPSVPNPSPLVHNPSPSVPNLSPSVPNLSPSVPNLSPSVSSPTIVTTPPVITGSYNDRTLGANNVITLSVGTTTPTPPPPPLPADSLIVSKQVAGSGSNIININNVDIAGLSSDGYNVYAYTTPNNSTANIAVNLTQPQTMNIFLVGGGGNGAGGGGGAGAIVSQTIVLPVGNYTISVIVGNTGRVGGSRDTTISYNNGAVKYIARVGGDSTGFNNASSRPGKGGCGAGAAWGGFNGSPGEAGIQTQSGNIDGRGKRSTIWAAGTGNTDNNNIANPGGKGLMNIDVPYNNCNVGNGGGGGAGSPGGDATLIQNIGGNDQDGNPIGPIKGGKGGDGILCTLPGIKNFTYNGKNWGQLYWAGGGGAGFSGYTYTHDKPIDYTKPTVSADGGKGGGGGGEGPWLTSDRNGPRASGIDDKSGLNPANDKNAYYLNSGGNTGGAGGLNTGGGGGGSFDSGAGGEGGSGIVIISFTK